MDVIYELTKKKKVQVRTCSKDLFKQLRAAEEKGNFKAQKFWVSQ